MNLFAIITILAIFSSMLVSSSPTAAELTIVQHYPTLLQRGTSLLSPMALAKNYTIAYSPTEANWLYTYFWSFILILSAILSDDVHTVKKTESSKEYTSYEEPIIFTEIFPSPGAPELGKTNTHYVEDEEIED
ncbi:hypothetical protein DSO57_1022989 [Entomophthora muscae]|uniref:Uncharacterized protein n=1 Tax=Entomophthora muscae TaxID=34485 RepID=A0ACC2T3X8_9FUNG|nr:hypothetical protein DSO57_1022989 [Entomophthora muscae]